MINKIKLFFIALNEAYMKLTNDQRKAKEAIDVTKVMLDIYKEKYNKLESVHKNLNEVYNQLPKSQRQLYIQQTLDLLRYGFIYKTFINDRGEKVIDCINMATLCRTGYLDRYKSFVDELSRIHKDMKNLYKEHKYLEVIEGEIDMKQTIDNFYNKYINDIEDPNPKQ